MFSRFAVVLLLSIVCVGVAVDIRETLSKGYQDIYQKDIPTRMDKNRKDPRRQPDEL